MLILLGLSFFILGTIIGSFLNVVILRYNTGKSVNGRSSCASCRKPLGAHELIPVLSFVMLRGKCSECKSRISSQYPLVEFFTGSLLFLIFIKLFLPQGPYLVLFQLHPFSYIFMSAYLIIQASLLVIIFVYDLKHKIIPNGPVYTFAFLALLKLLLSSPLIFSKPSVLFQSHSSLLWNIVAGPLFFLAFFLIWYLSRGKAMGFGDAKLVLGIGWVLGIAEGISALILSFWIGAVVSISLIISQYIFHTYLRKSRLKKKKGELTMKSEIPFAPFLILGLIIAYAYHLDILSLHLIFNI